MMLLENWSLIQICIPCLLSLLSRSLQFCCSDEQTCHCKFRRWYKLVCVCNCKMTSSSIFMLTDTLRHIHWAVNSCLSGQPYLGQRGKTGDDDDDAIFHWTHTYTHIFSESFTLCFVVSVRIYMLHKERRTELRVSSRATSLLFIQSFLVHLGLIDRWKKT